jgi:hypothetical protein
VETLGAEVVDVFYVTDGDGKKLNDSDLRRSTVHAVLAALGNLRRDLRTTRHGRPGSLVSCLRPYLTG